MYETLPFKCLRNNRLIVIVNRRMVIIVSKIIELTKITVIQKDTVNKIREAYIGDFKEPIMYGVHGGVREYYGVETDPEYPSTLDHLVAAAGG